LTKKCWKGYVLSPVPRGGGSRRGKGRGWRQSLYNLKREFHSIVGEVHKYLTVWFGRRDSEIIVPADWVFVYLFIWRYEF
jgi:hypothetical protein